MITFEYRFEKPSNHAPWRERFGARLDRIGERLCQRLVSGFAKGLLCRAKQEGVISNDQLHELVGRIDRRLSL